MGSWPEGRERLVAELMEPPLVASITSARPSSVANAMSVKPLLVKTPATIESAPPDAAPLPAEETTGVPKVPSPLPGYTATAYSPVLVEAMSTAMSRTLLSCPVKFPTTSPLPTYPEGRV